MKSAMQYRKFIDEPTMSDKTLLVSVEDLINTAFGTVEQNIVNFKLVQTVMHILARQMRMLEQDVEIKIDELADRPRRTYDERQEYDDDQPYASASTESRDQITAGEDGRGGGPRTERPGERSERGGGGREDDRTDDGTKDTTSAQGAYRGADAAEIDGSRGGGPKGRMEGGGAGRDDGGGRDDTRSGGGGTGGGGAGGGAGGAGAGGGVGAGGVGAGGGGAGGGGAGGGGAGGGGAGGGGAVGVGAGAGGAGGGGAVGGGGSGGRGGGGGGGGGGTAAGGGGGGREDAKSKDRGGQKAAGGAAGGGKKRAVSTDRGRKGTPDTGRSTATSAGRSSGRGSRTSITVTESTRKGGAGGPKDKILVVEKGPTTRGGGVARVGSIEVVTASQFALLEKAVRELENVAGPLPMPALPDNERLRQDLAQGRASLSETMQAMQLTARIQAAEDGLTRMAELLTQLAAAGALPQEMAGQIGQVRDQLQQAVTAVADAVGQAGGAYPGGPGMGPGGVGPGSASVGVGPQAVGGVAQGYGGPGMGPGGVGPAGVAPGMGPGGVAPGMGPSAVGPGMAPGAVGPGMGPGAVGPGMAPGGVGPGMGPGAVGPGMAPGGVGPGMGPDAVGPGMGPGGVGPGMVQGGVGPGMGPGGVGPGMAPDGVGPGMGPGGVGPGTGPGGVGPGMAQGGVGPGMAQGGVGPGMAQGGVGPGMAQGGVGPGMAQGGVGPGMAQGGVGPGMAQGGVGPGMAQGGVGPGMAQGGVGPGMAQGGVGPGMAQGGVGPGMAQGGVGPGMGPGGVGPAMGPGGVGPGMGPGGVGPGMGPGGMQQGYGGQGMGPGGVGPGMGPGGVGPGMGPGGVGPGMGPGGMGQGYGGQGMGPGGVGPGMGPGGMDQGYGGQGMGPGGGGPGGVGQGMGPGGVGPGMGPGGVGPGMRPGGGGPGGKRGGTGTGTSSTPGGVGAESYGPSGPPGRKSVAIDKTSSHPDSMRRGDGSGGTSRASVAAGARRPSEIAAASGLGTGGVGNVTHPEMESVLLIMRSELIKEITAMTTRATHSADIASNTSKAVADKLDVALNIDNRITKLFSLAKDYAEQLSGFDSGLATQMASFQEQMAQMRLDLKGGIQQLEQANNNAETAAILELSERYEGLVIELDNTLHTHQSLTVLQKQLSEELRSLVECVEMLREQKADRDEVLDGLRDKADITRLAGLLHEGDFAHAREDLEERLENCYKKFKRQDEIWLCALKDLAAITESKAEIIQLLAIKDTATEELKKIQESLRQLYIMLGEPKAAILMRMLAKGAACGSCLAPALMEPTDPDYGQPNALPALRPPPDGEEPCTVMLKPLPPPDARHHVCRRWVGGSHTLVGAPVSRERAVADTRAPPTKRFAGYGTDGRMYLLEEELQPCVECNKLSTDDQDEGPLPTPTGGGGDQGGGATPLEDPEKEKK
ncbi:uncharacterized PE-PGRS family protein PE_PGRS54-like [Helicoverpa zea]|uniref:uncharacterized PE-PGRS family protein PE_PGRS54-like n=1 Tax=Helicoverpa zea TaxID=7113 RepID=UPI001F5A32B7|nr:uncharacterized PE-PGRS family protein PE_PGRS54-like [Helicoverpa zea]